MRYILGFCVVLAIANPAWTLETSSVAGEPEYQTPAATVTSSVTQTTGTAALPATTPAGVYQAATAQPGTTAMSPAPTMTPSGVYQAATAQPGTTTMSPAPTMMSPGTYTPGTQPVTTYATPMPNTTNTTYSYPMTVRRGLFGMRSPIYSYPAAPVTTTYSTPVQTYSVMPGQTYYQPVRPRFGLFQRWRQQAMPVSGTPVYSTSGYAAPAYTTYYGYGTPAYYTPTYASPATTIPANSMTPAGSTTPVYTPTMLNVPNGTPAAGTAPAATAPVEPALQGATPAQAIPSLPGTGQATPSLVPPIPRSGPR